MDQASTKELRQDIGKRIRQVREAHRLSIPECAKLAKLHWRDFSAAEQGRLAFPTDALLNLCLQLGISPSGILSGTSNNRDEIAISLACHLYELTNEMADVSPQEFSLALRVALETGQQTGEIYVEDLKHFLDRAKRTEVLKAVE